MPIEQSIKTPAAIQHKWLVRWAGAVNCWNDRFDTAVLAGRRHGQIALTVSIEPLEIDHILLEAWVDLPAGRELVVERCLLPAHLHFDDRLLHIDCQLADREPLAVTLDHVGDEVLYARTTLPVRAGLAVGSLDPPTLGRHAMEVMAPLRACS